MQRFYKNFFNSSIFFISLVAAEKSYGVLLESDSFNAFANDKDADKIPIVSNSIKDITVVETTCVLILLLTCFKIKIFKFTLNYWHNMKSRYIIGNTCERKLSNYIDIGGAENEKNISTKKETK